jgi:hypothetical protein
MLTLLAGVVRGVPNKRCSPSSEHPTERARTTNKDRRANVEHHACCVPLLCPCAQYVCGSRVRSRVACVSRRWPARVLCCVRLCARLCGCIAGRALCALTVSLTAARALLRVERGQSRDSGRARRLRARVPRMGSRDGSTVPLDRRKKLTEGSRYGNRMNPSPRLSPRSNTSAQLPSPNVLQRP